MSGDDPGPRFDRGRRRCAVLAASLLFLVSAYAFLLSLPGRDSETAVGTRSEVTLMAGVLIAVCCAAIAAAARPSDCSGLVSSTKRGEASRGVGAGPHGSVSFRLVAHHCDCGRFEDHVLRVAGRERCAGCLGMAAGGIVGIGIVVALAAGLLFVTPGMALAMVLVASAASVGGLLQLYRRRSPTMLHTAANVSFVAGTVLLTALLATHGLLAGVFGLSAALAVVGLRIEMSRLRHLSIFRECPWGETCRGASAVARFA